MTTRFTPRPSRPTVKIVLPSLYAIRRPFGAHVTPVSCRRRSTSTEIRRTTFKLLSRIRTSWTPVTAIRRPSGDHATSSGLVTRIVRRRRERMSRTSTRLAADSANTSRSPGTKAIERPSGDQSRAMALCSDTCLRPRPSVPTTKMPPVPRLMSKRANASRRPSGDQLGERSSGPPVLGSLFVTARGFRALLSTTQICAAHWPIPSPFVHSRSPLLNATCSPFGDQAGSFAVARGTGRTPVGNVWRRSSRCGTSAQS